MFTGASPPIIADAYAVRLRADGDRLA